MKRLRDPYAVENSTECEKTQRSLRCREEHRTGGAAPTQLMVKTYLVLKLFYLHFSIMFRIQLPKLQNWKKKGLKCLQYTILRSFFTEHNFAVPDMHRVRFSLHVRGAKDKLVPVLEQIISSFCTFYAIYLLYTKLYIYIYIYIYIYSVYSVYWTRAQWF